MNPFARHDDLERRLRAAASVSGPVPPRELRGRILSALRAQPASAVPARVEPLRADPRGTWIAAAAAVLVLTGAWWLTRGGEIDPAPARSVAVLSRGILGAGSRVLALPARAEENLRQEAANLLFDTARVGKGLVRGLPAPLRAPLARM